MIDHSVQVDAFGTRGAFATNAELEFERNQERYAFLRWGQGAFDNFRVVPPDTGIVHQVNLEYLARVVFVDDAGDARRRAYPDTLVGTDSHTTMINGLGVLGWGVGGIEAEAAMLGQPVSMLIPQVVGFRLHGRAAGGRDRDRSRAHGHRDAPQAGRRRQVRRVLRRRAGSSLPLADRATIGNMSPEFGSTCAIFPIDAETLRYLELSGRPTELIELVEAYASEQGLWHDEDSEEPTFSDTLELDLATVVPSIAGPKRPAGPRVADRVKARVIARRWRDTCRRRLEDEAIAESFPASDSVSTHVPNGVGTSRAAVRRRAGGGAERRARPGHARGRDRD